jgi:hypothetical protein
VYEEGNWSVKGRFERVIDDDETIVWTNEGGDYSLKIGFVSIRHQKNLASY